MSHPATITVGTYEAKTKLTRLLNRVSKGGEVIITKHDRPVARLSPIAPAPGLTLAQAILRLDVMAKESKSGPESAKDLITAGRRL